jgi:hypothetical protein
LMSLGALQRVYPRLVLTVLYSNVIYLLVDSLGVPNSKHTLGTIKDIVSSPGVVQTLLEGK